MKTKALTQRLLILSSLTSVLAGGFPCLPAVAQTPPDLGSAFATSAEEWRTSTNTVALTWQATGGTPGGFLRGLGPAGTNAWFFVSPASWSGDWTGYKVLKFDFAIPSRHYPDADRAGMVVVVGANGQQMTWTGSTPLWTWTHYEVDLSASSFGVNQAVFDGIVANVAELRILAEFAVATETVGLDNVLVTAAPATAHETDLICRFNDGTTQGWRPVDDVTLSTISEGQPSFALKADDWMDGRVYKVATPVSWAGDWRKYLELRFDMHWTGGSASFPDVELVRVFGANGQSLSWSAPLPNGVWTHRSVPLTPETFGVTAAELEGVLAHVSEMWIVGEFTGNDDITYLDNIVLSTTTNGPTRLTQNLVSRFDTGADGWLGFDNCTVTWSADSGISGGGLKAADQGSGTARCQSPDAWIGDWRAFKTLRFMIRTQANARADLNTSVWIATWNGDNLYRSLSQPYASWTPYTVDLTPETFGVSVEQFEAIMKDVACLWIGTDLVGWNDTTLLDNVMLLTESGAGIPADHRSDFETGNDQWRYGGGNSGGLTWVFGGAAPWVATAGNPGGGLQNTDSHDWTYWFTPEAWAGDWRGLESVSFDFKIVSGTQLFDSRMISLCSPYTNLHAKVTVLPVPGQWGHFEFALNPATFGVSADVFEQTMRDVVFLGIRSEWISGSEVEALDNVRLSKAPDAYWAWIGGYFAGNDLADENIAGKLADPDGDGADNWCEFVADTVPTDPLDHLRIDRLSLAGDQVLLDFKTRTGRLYSIESIPALPAAGAWNAVTNDLPGTGLSLTVTNVAAGSPQFYRLKVRRGD